VLGEQPLGRLAQSAAEILDIVGRQGAGQGGESSVDRYILLQHKFT
jgi:hypothetical protein